MHFDRSDEHVLRNFSLFAQGTGLRNPQSVRKIFEIGRLIKTNSAVAGPIKTKLSEGRVRTVDIIRTKI